MFFTAWAMRAPSAPCFLFLHTSAAYVSDAGCGEDVHEGTSFMFWFGVKKFCIYLFILKRGKKN